MKRKATINSIAILLGIYGWALSLISIFKTGLGWDSYFDLNAAKISLENSHNPSLLTYYDKVPITSEFYGTFIYKISDWISNQFLDRSIFDNTLLISNYYVIDLTTWMISLVTVIIVSLTLYITLPSSYYALLFFGIISTLPIWIGMSQINSKDIPVASGITLLSSGFMLIFNNLHFKRDFYLGVVLISVGSGISISVRPAAIIIILMFVLFNTMVLFLINIKNFNFLEIFIKIIYIYFIIIIISLSMLYFSNPISLKNLAPWLLDAISTSLNYPSIQPVRVFGRDYLSNDLPKWYVAAWIWAQMPFLTFLSLIFGIISLIRTLILNKDLRLYYLVFPFLSQALLVPIFFLFHQPNMYNGIRHILFIYPALTLISVVFLVQVINYGKLISIKICTMIFVVTLLAMNAFAVYRWAPYSYAYINPISGIGTERNWDLDFWGLSAREGIEKLHTIGVSRKVFVMPDNSSSVPFGGLSINPANPPILPFALYVFIHWNHKIVEDKCEVNFRIMRDNQILGMGGSCFSRLS